MITDIWVDGKKIDLYSDTSIKHTFQVNDIAELKDRQTSFTNSFSVPKTNNNVQIFDGLGLPSDTSRVPYLKPDCKMKYDGFDLIIKGWMNVTETTDNYKIYVYSGIINFFKAIENQTLSVLDISEINHTKDLPSVIDSYNSDSAFRYFLADYNGQTHFSSDPTVINIDYMVPSVRVSYLWEKLHEKFNFPFVGEIFNTPDFKNLWLTYPKAPNISDLYLLITNANRNQRWETSFSNFFPMLPNASGGTPWRYSQFLDIPEDGNYRITFEVVTAPVHGTINYWMGINSEGLPLQNITNKTLLVSTTTPGGSYFQENKFLQAGTVLQLFFEKAGIPGSAAIDFIFNIKIEKVNKEDVNIQDGLSDFLISDFVKEVINIHALTIFPNENSREIKYKTIAERVRTAEVKDWTSYYIERTDEEYVATNYAQRNFFAFQYNDKEGTYHNGYIDVANQNIAASKTIFTSKTYAPERLKTKYFLNTTSEIDSDVFKFYDKQPDDNPANPPKYKGLEKRFYFIRESSGSYSIKIGSEASNDQQAITNAKVGSFTGLSWQNILGKFYGEYVTILNDSRLHTIELNFDIVDIIHLDFEKLYYFRQEQQYYILNKLNFDKNKTVGEFIRVKKATDSALVQIGVTIEWINANIGNSSTYSSYTAVATVIGNPTYTWQKKNPNGTWSDIANNTTPQLLNFTFGVNEFRVSFTNGNSSGLSNSLTYERKIEVDPAKCYRFDFTSLQGLQRTIQFINLLGMNDTVILNFADASEVKNIEAKQILNNGGATLINQVGIDCPVIPCKSYEASKYGGSGDDLTVSFIDCDGLDQSITQYASGVGQWLTIGPFCAREGTVLSNGTLNELGLC